MNIPYWLQAPFIWMQKRHEVSCCVYCHKGFKSWRVPLWMWNGPWGTKIRKCSFCEGGKLPDGQTCHDCYALGFVEIYHKWHFISLGYIFTKMVYYHQDRCKKNPNNYNFY
jgi:hypothetical protein